MLHSHPGDWYRVRGERSAGCDARSTGKRPSPARKQRGNEIRWDSLCDYDFTGSRSKGSKPALTTRKRTFVIWGRASIRISAAIGGDEPSRSPRKFGSPVVTVGHAVHHGR